MAASHPARRDAADKPQLLPATGCDDVPAGVAGECRSMADMDDLAADVTASAAGWRQAHAFVRTVREAAKRDPDAIAAKLVGLVMHALPFWRGRVQMLLADARPREAAWQAEMIFATHASAMWTVAEANIRYGLDLAAAAGENPPEKVVERVLIALEAAPASVALGALNWPDKDERGRLAVVLGGYVRSRLNLGRNRRLADAREAIGGEGELTTRLPAASLIAWAERTADDEQLGTFVNSVARSIETERAEPAERLDGLEEFAAREHARSDLRERVERAGLSAGEREVFELFLEGWPESAIAAKRGVAVGTVRSQKGRAFAKIRAA